MKLLTGLAAIPLAASTISITQVSNQSQVQAAANAWASGLGLGTPVMLESFEPSLGSPGPYSALLTNVGVFSVLPGSLPGDPVQSSGTKTNQFTILNAADSPFDGRYATNGVQWLDSNDITKLGLETTYEDLWFTITDADDVDGHLTIRTGDGTSVTLPSHLPNGNEFFVGINNVDVSLAFINDSRNDGYGLDHFGGIRTTVTPEPKATVFFLGLLMALVLFIRTRMLAR